MADPLQESRLLALPEELRLRIFSLALDQTDKIELQHPVWAGQGIFSQPLFGVSHAIRAEAVQAFYETNVFLWKVDTGFKLRSDPAEYPLPLTISDTSEYGRHSVPLLPTLPWEYPLLFQHLRRLWINIELPSERSEAWTEALPWRLERLVEVLEQGARLREFRLYFTAKRHDAEVTLNEHQRECLLVLGKMKVRGNVVASMGPGFRGVKGNVVESLGLAQMIKA